MNKKILDEKMSLVQAVKNQPLPWLVQIVTIIFYVGGLYMATQLFPLIRSIDAVVVRVNALEIESDRREPFVERFIQLEERDKLLVRDVSEIKEGIVEIRKALGGI